MIKGTNAFCRLTKVFISENTATITLLIYATKATVPAKSFRIAIKDTDTGDLSFVNNNVYWIDQVNNYDYDANNIDINKHREVMFNVDISRANKSSIQDNRWIRRCYIYLMDSSKDIHSIPAWSSDLLFLVSNDFEIPDVKNISFDTVEKTIVVNQLDERETHGKIKCKFDLKYLYEKDFNYNNKNFSATMNIRSVATNNILETKQIVTSSVSLYNEIVSSNSYKLGEKVVVQILITNKAGYVVRDVRKIYRPVDKYSNSFIKTDNGIKRVIAYYVNTDSKTEHEGEWLDGNN